MLWSCFERPDFIFRTLHASGSTNLSLPLLSVWGWQSTERQPLHLSTNSYLPKRILLIFRNQFPTCNINWPMQKLRSDCFSRSRNIISEKYLEQWWLLQLSRKLNWSSLQLANLIYELKFEVCFRYLLISAKATSITRHRLLTCAGQIIVQRVRKHWCTHYLLTLMLEGMSIWHDRWHLEQVHISKCSPKDGTCNYLWTLSDLGDRIIWRNVEYIM